MSNQGPLPRGQAWRAVARCFVTSLVMLVRGQVHLSRKNVGRRLLFADGTTSPVYRETVAEGRPAEPCLLVVSFRLRGIRRRQAHAIFRAESILNTPLFVGFPGFVSKLWLADDERGTYRGLYEWDGPERAEHYARSLWRVLALVSEKGSIAYQVVPGLSRDRALAEPALLARNDSSDDAGWWQVVNP
jgi:hypothetical protein